MALRRVSSRSRGRTDEELRQALNESVALSLDLDGVDLRVYLYLSSVLNFSELRQVPQVQIAVALGRQKTHISRSVRKLVEVGVLIPGPKGTRASEWMLNRDYGA